MSTSNKNIVGAINEVNQRSKDNDSQIQALSNSKQSKIDFTLQTNAKEIVPAINEVNSIAKGAQQAISYDSYQTMVTAFNALSSTAYNLGQSIFIITLSVPDLWISGIGTQSI